MLDEKDLQAIARLMDEKIQASEQRMSEMMSEKIQASEERMSEKIQTSQSQVIAYIECKVMPQIRLVAEGHQLLLETMAPLPRVEALEQEVTYINNQIHSMKRDIAALKKAQ